MNEDEVLQLARTAEEFGLAQMWLIAGKDGTSTRNVYWAAKVVTMDDPTGASTDEAAHVRLPNNDPRHDQESADIVVVVPADWSQEAIQDELGQLADAYGIYEPRIEVDPWQYAGLAEAMANIQTFMERHGMEPGQPPVGSGRTAQLAEQGAAGPDLSPE